MWIYVFICVGIHCPFATYPSPNDPPLLGWETKAACDDAGDLKVEDFGQRYGIKDHTFYFACANRGIEHNNGERDNL